MTFSTEQLAALLDSGALARFRVARREMKDDTEGFGAERDRRAERRREQRR
jgi:hypothetical protein